LKKVVNSCNKICKEGKRSRIPTAQPRYILCDVTNKCGVRSMIREADKLAREDYLAFTEAYIDNSNHNFIHGEVDKEKNLPPPVASILVNSAGITKDGFLHTISQEDYDQVLNVNLKGTFLTCQSFCEPLRLESIGEKARHKGLSIINIGSIVSEFGNVGQSNYAASKGGVVGLTRALAKEMAFSSGRVNNLKQFDTKDNSIQQLPFVRVNAILPGFISSPMSHLIPPRDRERILNKIPLKRFGNVDDVANMALFLASTERSGYVTGECWECSGMIAL